VPPDALSAPGCHVLAQSTQVSTFLSDLETAAAAAVEGGPDSGEAVAKLLRAVAGVRDQVNRFSTERSGLKARRTLLTCCCGCCSRACTVGLFHGQQHLSCRQRR
jgi:hypothetical protein